MTQESERPELQRLDTWLNISCLYKTRSQAAKACQERRVKVNDKVAKPATMIRVGDKITLKTAAGKFITLTVLGLSQKNLPIKEARLLYQKEEPQLTEEAKELLHLFAESFKVHRPKYKGRPTKKERRKLEKILKKF